MKLRRYKAPEGLTTWVTAIMNKKKRPEKQAVDIIKNG